MEKDIELIEKYEDSKPIYNLVGGVGEVIGKEAGEDNEMIYIVKTEDTYTVVSASTCPIVRTIHKTEGYKKTISIPMQNT